MGACVSAPERCVGGRLKKRKNRKRRRVGGLKQRVSSRLSEGSLDRVDRSAPSDRSHANPTFQGAGHVEEAWFDSAAVLESDCDEDYQSVADDVSSLNGFEGASVSSIPSLRDANHWDHNLNSHHTYSTNHMQKLADLSTGNSALDSVNEVSRCDGPSNEANHPVYLDEVSSSVDGSPGKEGGVLDNCGILPSNCLPCLASTVHSVEKRRSLSSSPPSSRKKASLKLSFKWKDGNVNGPLFSSKMLLERPIAGSQVPFCPIDKKMLDCWSHIEPSTFKVRAVNYFRDKRKEFASNYAAYYPFGVDVFLSQRKITHIARFVELPSVNSSGNLPPLLIVNVQGKLFSLEHDSSLKPI
ncbi:hypothetical protein CMV_025342 [Castanea mollissima]|uniref:Protein ENHANCED DISEASE RESISTANCE 2 C-terminal domain-containing protein n=1 Tax=Castanea mollissima TaxID=60419 RepID=A0A8J4QG74_9ROSI|nr:hypothetical protein CMV_025342 [Castanea mollissima]